MSSPHFLSLRLVRSIGAKAAPSAVRRSYSTINTMGRTSHRNRYAPSYSSSFSRILPFPILPSIFSTAASVNSSPLPFPCQFQHRTMFIQTQTTPNANSLKFIPGRDVSPSVSVDFKSYRDAVKSSPLAALLFGIDGVKSVYLASDFISINIEEGRDWNLIKPEVYACIMDFYASGKPVLLDPSESSAVPISSTTILPTDSEVVSMIKELIETRIRPAVQEDGGDIDYKSFDEATGKVLVQMQGSCKGCSSSAITLKNGIENMLMHYVPEVKSVEEYVDEEVQSVSEDALKKLESKLEETRTKQSEQPQPIPKASPI